MHAPQFTDHFLTTAEGPRIAYRVYEAEGGEETGVPILCLHGLTRNLLDFEDLAPRLAMMGRKVITASQRGRGDSDVETDSERYSPIIYTGDMLALLDHLCIKEAIFIGTSMGGLMTMIAASASPERVKGAVLNDIGPEIDPAGIARIQGYVGKTGPVANWEDAAAAVRAVNGAAFPKETGDEFWLDFAKKTFRSREDGQLELAYDPLISKSVVPKDGETPDLWPLFDALQGTPTLVLRGKITDILSEETLEKMKARHKDLKVVQIPDVGHAPTLTEPGSWTAIRNFVSEVG
jgi:pimeloyl-ACP methyl ester carboxylesterase